MSKVLKRRWRSEVASGLPRRDRASCDYQAYLPDHLVGRAVRLEGEVVADVTDAEAAIARFDAKATALADTEALARLLLRAESVASSRIEGLEVGGRRLLRAEAAQSLGDEANDVTAVEVLGNIKAMSWALNSVGPGDDITVEALFEAHRQLLAGTRLEEMGGHIRKEQNWIGGSSFNPCSAAFVPAPPEYVPDFLEDLCAFCNTDSLPAVIQAALAHAQFETIHPFVDGNGRIGRALIHLVLRRRALAVRVLPPISLVLATWSRDYIAGLTATRYFGSPASKIALEGLNRWVGLFAAACRRAVSDAESFEIQVSDLQSHWRAQLQFGPTRVSCRFAYQCITRRADRDGERCRRSHRSKLSGDEPGHLAAGGSGHSQAGQRRTTQQSLRGGGVDPTLHGTRTSPRESNGEHPVIGTVTARTATTRSKVTTD